MRFYIDLEDASGNKLGPGPITSAAGWSYTARMDRAGTFAFEMPAGDAMAVYVTRKRKARAWALLDGAWVEVGAGIIDRIERRPAADGTVTLAVSGDDELRELAQRSIGDLALASGNAAISHAAAVAAVAGAVATGWTLTADSAPGNDSIYGQFAGETVLQALIQLASKCDTHFYRSGPRALTFASAWSDSGIHAVQAQGDLAAETCAIVALTETLDSYDLSTRIVPLGAGNGAARLTLATTTQTAPPGYTLNAAANWLQNDAAVATYGVIDAPWIEFKDVRPISNTSGDVQAAADMLFALALAELRRRSVTIEQATYIVALAECAALLRPLQTVRVSYAAPDRAIVVDADLNILEATWQIDAEGVRTTAIQCTTGDRWPQSSADVLVGRIAESSMYQAHPQLNANGYVIAFTKNLDDDQSNPAEFRFRFDDEVTQLTRCVFDFQLLPLESTVKSVGASSVTAVANGDHTHGVTIADHTHSVTVPSHTHTVTIPAHDHNVTIGNHAHSVTVPSHTHGVTISSHTHGIPNHQHYWVVDPGSTSSAVMVYSSGGGGGGIVASGIGSQIRVYTSSDSGSTTSSSGGGATVTSAGGGGATVTAADGGSTSVTSGAGGGSTPTSGAGGGSTPTSSAGGGSTVSAASGGSHTHEVTPVVTTVYGVFRDSLANVFGLADLEYSLDGAGWYGFAVGVNGFASLGDGYYRVDLTALLVDGTLRPANNNNALQMRRKSAGATGKRCTIDAQMSIRTIIQAIAYT